MNESLLKAFDDIDAKYGGAQAQPSVPTGQVGPTPMNPQAPGALPGQPSVAMQDPGQPAQPPAPMQPANPYDRLGGTPVDYLMNRAGQGVVRGLAGMADGVVDASRWVESKMGLGRTRTDDEPKGLGLTKFVDEQAAKQNAPYLRNIQGAQDRLAAGNGSTIDNFIDGAALGTDAWVRPIGGALGVVGEIAGPGGIGNAGVQVLAKSAASRLPQSAETARRVLDTFRNYGAGPAPIGKAAEGAGITAKTGRALAGAGTRMAAGGAATGTAALIADPSDPGSALQAAGAGGVLGPVAQKTGEGATKAWDAVSRAVMPNRVNDIVQDVLAETAGTRAKKIADDLRRGLRPGSNIDRSGLVPQTPAQKANDLGISGLTRTVEDRVPDFANNNAQFLEEQAARQAQLLRRASSGVPDLEAARKAATQPGFDQITNAKTPISMNVPFRTIDDLRNTRFVGNNGVTDTIDSTLRKHYYTSDREGFYKHVPSGTVRNTVGEINEKLRPGYNFGQTEPWNEKTRLAMGEISDALTRALEGNRKIGPIARQTNDLFKDMSIPINQKNIIIDIYNKGMNAQKATLGNAAGQSTLSASKFAAAMNEARSNSKVWDQLSKKQKTMLERTERELTVNAKSMRRGAKQDAAIDESISPDLINLEKTVPGMPGRVLRAGDSMIMGAQSKRVNEALAKLLSSPKGRDATTVRALADELERGRSKPMAPLGEDYYPLTPRAAALYYGTQE